MHSVKSLLQASTQPSCVCTRWRALNVPCRPHRNEHLALRAASWVAAATKSERSCEKNALAVNRRDLHRAMVLLGVQLVVAPLALPAQSRGLSNYIRRKKLDALDNYVPLVLEAEEQLQFAGRVMEKSPGAARDLLRQGAFQGLRDNIRALGEYAVAVEAYDRTLFESVRTESDLDVAKARKNLDDTLAALDRLIATVPADVLQQSRDVLSAVNAKQADVNSEQAAPPASEDDEDLEALLATGSP